MTFKRPHANKQKQSCKLSRLNSRTEEHHICSNCVHGNSVYVLHEIVPKAHQHLCNMHCLNLISEYNFSSIIKKFKIPKTLTSTKCVTYRCFPFFTGLGPTVPELDVSGLPLFQKTHFSMCLPEVKEHLKQYPGNFDAHLSLQDFGTKMYVSINFCCTL